MVMYDHVKCCVELPDQYVPAEGRTFQTKDFGCHLDQYTISEDGRLLARLAQPHSSGKPVDSFFSGQFSFYDYDREHDRREYVAHFESGRLVAINLHPEHFEFEEKSEDQRLRRFDFNA